MSTKEELPYAGRGAQSNPSHRFANARYDDKIIWEEEDLADEKTQYIEVFPKTIVNAVKSPDIYFSYSLNPYEGCEHGCTYCYARNTHPYWGYSAGLDFERMILVKKNAPDLLRKTFQKKSWKAAPIMVSGNTDCYQPIEHKLKITRALLEIFLAHKHPLGLITKNSLILRDLDVLQELAAHNLVSVAITITTLDEEVRRKMEPRTVSAVKRLATIEKLAKHNIPVMCMMAPIIPGLNDHEIFQMAKAVSESGAFGMGNTILRLNGEVEQVFTDWLELAFPMKKDKILHQTAACHGGALQDNRFGKRMRGEGVIATSLQRQLSMAREKFFKGKKIPVLDSTLFCHETGGQIELF